MEATTLKTFAVFAVIFGCFAVLYPKIFHPMLMHMFGMAPDRNTNDEFLSAMPPHLRKPGMAGAARHTSGRGDDVISRMKHTGPHPGMRAAAEMQKQAGSQGGGRGGGMMGVVLPMYAIGIVLYLLYTLSKVFSGKKEKMKEDEAYVKKRMRGAMSNVRYSADRGKFIYGEEDSEGENDEQFAMRQSKRKQRDLERLLFKADKDKISELEMRELKRRLLETEAQMTRILSAMETVQDRVTQHVEDDEDDSVQRPPDDDVRARKQQQRYQKPAQPARRKPRQTPASGRKPHLPAETLRQRFRPSARAEHAEYADDYDENNMYETHDQRQERFMARDQYGDDDEGREFQDGDDGDFQENVGDGFQYAEEEEDDYDYDENYDNGATGQHPQEYEDDFESSESEIGEIDGVEEIDIEESEEEEFYERESRGECDGEEDDGRLRAENENESGESPEENGTESGGFPDDHETESGGSDDLSNENQKALDSDLRKRTVKSNDPKNHED